MGKDRRLAAMAVAASTCLALSWAPAVAIAHEAAGPTALEAAVQGSTENLPKTIEFHKMTGDIKAGQTYQLVSSEPGTAGNKQRILHLSKGTTKLDRCGADSVGDKLSPSDCAVGAYKNTHAHEWTIEKVDGGFTIKSNTDNGPYITLTENGAVGSATPQTLTIEKGDGGCRISAIVGDETRYLCYGNSGWTSSTESYDVLLYQRVEVTPTVLPNGKDTVGVTQGQPFAQGTGGSGNFRIPSLITGANGSLFAAIDARWNHQGDAAGLDTIFSRSDDGGATWSFSFPNYFNDSVDSFNNEATAFIDPVMVEKDGVMYMMVDLWPGGVALNTAKHQDPINASGYVEIDGKQRMVLFGSPVPADQRAAGAEKGEGHTHYIGDFGTDGLAPVIAVADGTTTNYVNRQYYLFDADKKPLYCQQLGSSDYVQQNVFYYKADLHVVATSHLWLTSSTDGGKTWSDPLMLNEQVRTGLKEGNASFYGVGPGRGLVTSKGRIILPCYTFTRGQGDGNTSVIYSDDGVTWHRSQALKAQTSEATVVEADGRLYLFARHGVYAVSNDGGATWENERRIRDMGININQGCQISAITYSKLIDGKTAIILSCPTGDSRANGRLFVGLVQEDGDIEWKYEHEVTSGGDAFAYSCVTEAQDGSLALLYEGSSGTRFVTYEISDVAEHAQVGNERKVNVPLYGSIELRVPDSFAGYEAVDSSVLGIEVKANEDGSSTVVLTGKKEGSVSFVEKHSGVEYQITVAPARLVEKVVAPGETVSIPVGEGELTLSPDLEIARASLSSGLYADELGETPGSLGTDASYTGDVIGLSQAMYMFSAAGEGQWKISGKTAAGETVCLDLSTPGFPSAETAKDIELRAGDSEGTFKLYSKDANRHLHFYRDGQAVFDRCQNDTSGADSFELYTKASASGDGVTEAAADSDIPGFVRVANLSGVKDGQAYLIVARVGDTLYALNPSNDKTNKHAHVVKVDPERRNSVLKVTGVAPGVTDAMVGDTVYRITVAGYLAPEFVWSDDCSEATATFKHTAGGETRKLACKVTSVRTEPTETKDGLVVYTAEVEFEGNVYRDEKRVVLPAIGEQEPGGGTGGATDQTPGQGSGQKPNGSAGSNGGASLPRTGDLVSIVGLLSAAGISLSAIGARLFRRKS